ncbi:MAG: hypothetical protein KBG49_05875 [Spirochaetes bacterium]|nr:hypothetical protein [Spirochaetota bacterium]
MSDEVKRKIESIEKRIVELKYAERDVERERDIIRYEMLKKAENSPVILKLIEMFFIKELRVNMDELRLLSEPAAFKGRDGEEFLSEVKVDVRYNNTKSKDYREIGFVIYLTEGFQIEEVRKKEIEMMDRIISIRKEIEELRAQKRSLRLK